MTIEVERPGETVGLQGTEKHVSIGPDKDFNILTFRRALHHIAFNIFAADKSVHHALKPHLNPVRKYVRHPDAGEAWPFVQIVEDLREIRPEVRGRIVPEGPGDTVLVRIFNCDFYVDLLNRGGLGTWAGKTFDDPSAYVGPDWKPERRDKIGGLRRHRITIGPE